MNSFAETFRNLGPARLGMMVAVAAGIVAFFIYLTSRLATPDLALLYADLDPQDSGQIVSRLEQREVTYRLDRDGGQIFVPRDQVGRLRVAMAEEGLPRGGSVGYEIFDRADGLGTTKFVQNINHLRALEGELARTIRSIAQIRRARVHLVLGRRELFSRDRQEPSASIVIGMRGNNRLERRQVLAIQHLVAAAVPGLKPTMVSIVDSQGALLARGAAEDDLQNTATTGEEMRIAFESRMVRTIEDLLERYVGPDNVRARVSAEMDFDRVTENAEIFDPDGQVVRSTQVVEEQSGTTDAQGLPPVTVGGNLPDSGLPSLGAGTGSQSSSTRNEETVNYEISKTVKTHVRETGVVRRLSVAVMVNGTMAQNEAGEAVYTPRSPEEIERLATLVRSAVGFNEARGDTLEIANLRFADLSVEMPEESSAGFLGFDPGSLMRAAELLVLGVVAVLVLLLVVRPLVGRMLEGGQEGAAGQLTDQSGARAALPAAEDDGTLEPSNTEVMAEEIDHMIDLNKVQGRVRASSVRKIGEIVDKHPEEAVAIVRSWLYQES
ncbi:MAG: flagellar basal-body MS-ring/collar protein FliF [Kiloniellaceae bacterium]